MLPDATPFPQVGSYCLLAADPERARPEAQLARIQFWPDADTAVVALPLVEGSRGTTRAGRGELVSGAPLTDAEQRELTGLCRRGLSTIPAHPEALEGDPKRNLSARQRKRFDLLQRREADARRMDALMKLLAHRKLRASLAERVAA